MTPRIVRVCQSVEEFTDLFAAARAAGLRIGWLDLDGQREIPAAVGVAAGSGAFRAVAVVGSDVLSCKRLLGPAVLRDLVREHFTGCRLLLVRGSVDAPEFSAVKGGWRVRSSDGEAPVLSTDELLARLRQPRFP